MDVVNWSKITVVATPDPIDLPLFKMCNKKKKSGTSVNF